MGAATDFLMMGSRVRGWEAVVAQPVFSGVDGRKHSSILVDSSSMGNGDGSMGNSVGVVGVSVDGGGDGLLDDGLSLDGDGVGHGIGGINMDGGGDLDDLLLVDGHIIRDLNTTLNIDGLVDGVHLSLGLDDGSVDRVGSLQVGAHADGQEGGGGLVDVGVVSGNVAGLSVVDLLGDDGSGLVEGGHTGGLGLSGVGGGHGDSGGGNSHGGSVGHSHRGGDGMAGEDMASEGMASDHSGGGSAVGRADDECKCDKGPHDAAVIELA